jgi:glycine cleavage system H protein
MKYYTSEHQWFDQDLYRVGLSSFARGELGQIVYLQMPKVGDKIEEGQILCILESTKSAADVYAPYSGIVSELNPEALNFINEDPEKNGWLVTLIPDPAIKSDRFLTPIQYHEMISM